MIIDTHIHLTADDFQKDLDNFLKEALAANVRYFICIGAGYGIETARSALSLANQYDNIFASTGIHPHDADESYEMDLLFKLASKEKVVAIGETGLDFYYENSSKENQYKCFKEQIALAKEVGKPLIIHCRDAAEEVLSVLKKEDAQKIGGVFHCYSESADFAKELAAINFMVSFPGILTFKKSEALRRAAKDIPLSQIMLETDAPYLSPEPKRGKLCHPAYIKYTAEKLAEVKNLTLKEVEKATSNNAIQFFNLPIGRPLS